MHGIPFNRCLNPACALGGTPLAAGSSTDEILFNTHSGLNGSTNTNVSVFSVLPTSTDIYTVASTAADGSSARIDQSGIYLVSAGFGLSETTGAQTSDCAITLDSTDLIGAWTVTASYVRAYQRIDGDVAGDNPSVYLTSVVVISQAVAAATDQGFVRSQIFPITDVDTGDAVCSLRITRIADFES